MDLNGVPIYIENFPWSITHALSNLEFDFNFGKNLERIIFVLSKYEDEILIRIILFFGLIYGFAVCKKTKCLY